MAASNPIGEMQYWDSGVPFQGVKLGSNNSGEMQYWDSGFPMQFIFPTNNVLQVLTLLGCGS